MVYKRFFKTGVRTQIVIAKYAPIEVQLVDGHGRARSGKARLRLPDGETCVRDLDAGGFVRCDEVLFGDVTLEFPIEGDASAPPAKDPAPGNANGVALEKTAAEARQGIRLRTGKAYRVTVPLAGAFTDLAWKKTGGGVRLEAETTLPDGACRFTVYKCDRADVPLPPPDSRGGGARPEPGTVLGTVAGTIQGGVASAAWTPPEGYHPFDHESWIVVHPDDATLEDMLAARPVEPPVFCVESGETWSFSLPPGVPLKRVAVSGKSDARGTALTADGHLVPFQARGGNVDAADHVVVVALLFRDGCDVVVAGQDAS